MSTVLWGAQMTTAVGGRIARTPEQEGLVGLCNHLSLISSLSLIDFYTFNTARQRRSARAACFSLHNLRFRAPSHHVSLRKN